MRTTAATVVFGLFAAPLLAGPSSFAPSLLERAGIAAASGTWRAQNTGQITTGRIRPDDRKRSAIAFAISGAAAFVGAALWRFVPCRGVKPGDAQDVGGVALKGSQSLKCYEPDGSRSGFNTPTKLLLGAGVALELVAIGYLIAHLRQGDDDGPAPARSSARQQPVDKAPRMGIRPRRDGEPGRPGGCGALSPPDGGPNRWRDPFRRLSRGGRTLPAPLPGGASRRVGARGTLSTACQEPR